MSTSCVVQIPKKRLKYWRGEIFKILTVDRRRFREIPPFLKEVCIAESEKTPQEVIQIPEDVQNQNRHHENHVNLQNKPEITRDKSPKQTNTAVKPDKHSKNTKKIIVRFLLIYTTNQKLS